MSAFRSVLFRTLIGCLLASVGQGAQALSVLPATPAEQLAVLAERYVDGTFELNPITATWYGDARYAGKFVNNLTPAHRDKERKLNADTLRKSQTA